MTQAAQQVTLRVDEGVAEMTIQRPPLNILDKALLGQLSEALGDAGVRTDWRVLVLRGILTSADLNPSAVHRDTRHLRNLVGRTRAPRRQRQLLVHRRLRFRLGDALFADALGPPLDPLARDRQFGQRFQIFRRLDEGGRLRPGVGHLLQHALREGTVGLNPERTGQREKKPCDSKGSSTPVRRSSSVRGG